MALRVGVGYGDDLDSAREAAEEAVEEALEAMQGEAPVMAIVFASIDFDQEALMAGLKDALGGIPMIGCTTDGEINSEGVFHDSVSVMVLGGEALQVKVGLAEGVGADARGRAKGCAEALKDALGTDPTFAIILPDTSGNGKIVEILEGMKAALGQGFPLFGGQPGDKQRLTGTTYQYFNYTVHRDSMPVLLFGGGITFAAGLKAGVRPLGAQAICTKTQDNLLLEIEGKAAIEHHRHYIGDQVDVPATIANFPYLLVAGLDNEGEEVYVVRTPFFYIKESGAIACDAPLPEGSTIRIGRCTREAILDAATQAAESLKADLAGRRPEALLVFSCSGRKQHLGFQVGEEFNNIRAVLGEDVPVLGFFSYGELGPIAGPKGESESQYHGYTLSMLALAA